MTNSSPPTRAIESAGPQDGREPRRRFDQDGVTGVVAAGVVDLLEVVEVAEQEGDLAATALGSGDRGGDPIEEQPPVRQAGEGVMQAHLRHFGFGPVKKDLVDVATQLGGFRYLAFRPTRGCGR